MKYRSRTDIVNAILRAIPPTGASKTKLMYAAYISFSQAKEYLPYLESRELVRLDRTSQLYRLTERGSQIIRLYNSMAELMAGGPGGFDSPNEKVQAPAELAKEPSDVSLAAVRSSRQFRPSVP